MHKQPFAMRRLGLVVGLLAAMLGGCAVTEKPAEPACVAGLERWVMTELFFGLWSLLFREWSFLAQLGVAGLFAAVLAYTERHDDEHLVPSAIRYYASRRWGVLYGGARDDPYVGHPLEGLVEGGPWRR